jgi:hypothetical protein
LNTATVKHEVEEGWIGLFNLVAPAKYVRVDRPRHSGSKMLSGLHGIENGERCSKDATTHAENWIVEERNTVVNSAGVTGAYERLVE